MLFVLSDTQVSLLGDMLHARNIYPDVIYARPLDIQHDLPYIEASVDILVIIRGMVDWGLGSLVPLLEFTKTMSMGGFYVLSQISVDASFNFPVLSIRKGFDCPVGDKGLLAEYRAMLGRYSVPKAVRIVNARHNVDLPSSDSMLSKFRTLPCDFDSVLCDVGLIGSPSTGF